MPRRTGGRARPGAVRIIAGQWRGRKLPVLDAPGLRPTPDRVRETLFNWLSPILPGARCLDLFAGTGVLGFEALSRGAAEAVLVERAAPVADALRAAQTRLGATGARILQTDACAWLARTEQAAPFDVVFLDPPYREVSLAQCCRWLAEGGWLNPDARVYVEMAAGEEIDWPAGWEVLRTLRAGQVNVALLRVMPAAQEQETLHA